jgi:hypothetical protein
MDEILAVILTIIIILLTIAVLYFSARMSTTGKIRTKREDMDAEIQNVAFHSSTYRRKVERAKEILTLGFMIRENIGLNTNRSDASGLDIPNSFLPAGVVVNQPYNMYNLLEKVFEEIMNAENELLNGITKANENLRKYNIYIQTPYLPSLIASELGLSPISYDSTRLTEIDGRLNQGLREISLVETNINQLLSQYGGALPSRATRPEAIGTDANNLELMPPQNDDQMDLLGQ